jgi:hypothetical protein
LTITVGLLQQDTLSTRKKVIELASREAGLKSHVLGLNPSSSELVVVAVVVAHIGLTFGRKP